MTTYEPASAEDVVLYDLDDTYDPDDLKAMLADVSTRWFAEKRLAVLARQGLVASIFDPNLHPRGHDGKFIEKGGWIRWLKDGKWHTAKVWNIDEHGVIYVHEPTTNPDWPNGVIPTSFSSSEASKMLYAAPTPKAKLSLPDPKNPDLGGNGWKKVGGQGGSNPGGLYEALTTILPALDPSMGPDTQVPVIESGDKWYVKHGKSTQHIANEVMANRLYEMAGVAIADVQLSHDSPDLLASKIVPFTDSKTDLGSSPAPEVLKKVQDDFIIDAWLANWDVVGLGYENIQVVDGTPYRIDAGGSLLYRAQGGPKGSNFGPTVGEIDSMRDTINPSGYKIFGTTTDAQMQAGAERIAAIKPQDIHDLAAELGMPDSTADTIVARRAYILDKFGVTDPWLAENVAVIPEPTPPAAPEAPSVGLPELKAGQYYAWNGTSWGVGNNAGIVDVANESQAMKDIIHQDGKVVPVSSIQPGDYAVARGGRVYKVNNKMQPAVTGTTGVWASATDLADGSETSAWLPAESIVLSPAGADAYAQHEIAIDNAYISNFGTIDAPTFIGLQSGWHTNPYGDAYIPRFIQNEHGYQYAEQQYVYSTQSQMFFSVKPTAIQDKYTFMSLGDGTYVDLYVDPNVSLNGFNWIAPGSFSEKFVKAWAAAHPLPTETPVPVDQTAVHDMDVKAAIYDLPIVEPDTPSEPAVPAIADAADVAGAGLPAPKQFDYINPKIHVVDNGVDLLVLGQSDPAAAKAAADGLVGHVVYFHNTEALDGLQPDGSVAINGKYSGLLYVESVQVSQTGKLQLTARIPTGNQQNITVDKSMYNAWPGMWHVVDNVSVDQFKTMGTPTFKANGDIVANGHIVGSYTKSEGYWSNDYAVTIFAEHSSTGKVMTRTYKKLNQARAGVAYRLVAQPAPVIVKSKKKSAAVKKIETVVPSIPKTSGAKYVDGSEAAIGDWVQSTKGGGGFVGKITGFPNTEQHPGLAFAVDENGVQKIVKVKTQKKVPGPSIETALTAVPNAYEDLKYGDGSTPQIGQLVEAAGVTGIVSNVNTKQGWVYILQPGAEKPVSKTFSVVKVKEEPKLIWNYDNEVVAAALAAGAVGAVVPGSTGKKTKKGKGPTYVLSGGTVLDQPQAAKDEWLAGHPNRKLTKDGYAPYKGMIVRNSVGDQIVVDTVASTWDPHPNQIKGYNLTKGKSATTSTTAVEVDHIVMTTSALTGETIPKVSSVEAPWADGTDTPTFPDGSIIYSMTSQDSYWSNTTSTYRQIDVERYIVVRPDGTFASILTYNSGNGAYLNEPYYNASFKNLFGYNGGTSENSFKPVAVIDSKSDKYLAHTPYSKQYIEGNYKITPAQSALVDNGKPFEGALATDPIKPVVKAPEAPAVPEVSTPEAPAAPEAPSITTTELALPKIVAASSLSVSLTPPPAPPDSSVQKPTDPPIPQIGAPVPLDQKPAGLTSATSIHEAAVRILDLKGSSAEGSGMTYGLGDSDLVDDMLFRHTIERRNGQEYLVTRFRLREDPSEDTLGLLVTPEHGVKLGNWKTKGNEYPNDLKDGDAIYVRLSGTTKLLKPNLSDNNQAPSPNARVVGEPKMIGISPIKWNNEDVELWRVQVATQDGQLGEVDMQMRPGGSIHVYEWDPNAPAPASNQKLKVTDTAAQAGWSKAGAMWVPGSQGQIMVDKAGVIDYGGSQVTGMANGTGGSHMVRHLDDGTVIDWNNAHKTEGGTGNETTRRAVISGEVRIAIPLTDGRPAEDITASLSKAMQAVGVPPEKQKPPTNDDLTLLALEKFVSNYHPSFTYRDKPITGPNDKRVQETLDYMTKELSSQLGRPVTIDDIRIKQHKTGRMQVVLSHDVAKAISKRQGITYFGHSGVGGSTVVDLFGGPMSGLMATDERWSAGILRTGQSSHTDMKIGSGDRVYMRGHNGQSYNAGYVVMAGPMITSSTEVYNNQHNSSDNFGRRGTQNHFMVTGTGRESMYKRRIEPEMITFYVVSSSQQKDEIIAELVKRGITEINNRPISEIIVTPTEASKQGDLSDIGAHYWDDTVSIASLIGT